MNNKKLLTFAILFTIAMIASTAVINFLDRKAEERNYATFVESQSDGLERKDVIFLTGSNPVLRVEIADSAEERTTGLMYRKEMGEDEGMLFIFENPSQLNFWMKNTYLPLDIIFLDEEKRIVKIHHSTKPLDTNILYPSEVDAKYVIETNGGYVIRKGIKEGDSVNF